MVQFGGQYTFEQFRDAQKALSGLRTPFRWMLVPVLAVLAASFLTPADAGWTAEGIFLLLVLVAVGAWMYFRGRSAGRQNFESNEVLRAPLRGTADESGLEIVSEYSNSRTPWSVYRQVSVASRVVLLHQAADQAIFIPRDFFASEDDWNRFIGIVRENVKAPPPARWRNIVKLLVWMAIFAAVVLIWNVITNS